MIITNSRNLTEGLEVEHEDLSYGMRLVGYNPVADNIGELGQTLARDPAALTRAFADLGLQQIEVALGAARQLLGVQPPPLELPRGDKRFEDRAWRDNPFLRATVESYLNVARWSNELIEAADIPDGQRRRARFGLNLLLDAAAPSNAPWLNPAVMKEALDTGGLSLLKGAMNMLEDMVRNEGRPRQVDTSGFELGRNLAATPSRVVLRNDLVELLAYEPQTDKVYEQPILCSPPWINKYYVMDLAPGRSFIEHAVQNGFTVFCMSYRNPDASMSQYGLDEYLVRGVLASLDRVQEITRAPIVNLFGLCAGGTMTAITLAHLAARSQSSRIGWAGVTNTLLDFHDAGELGALTDEQAIAHVESEMSKGYLAASDMASSFDWLRGNDLVWNYVVSNWYLGKQPPAFDILAWNGDSVNVSRVLHTQWLRSFYLNNELVRPGAMTVNETPIDLGQISTPLYVLGAEADHITPWRGTYQTTQLVGGEVRYVLSSSGHIAGIVNPPSNTKSRHWTSETTPPDPDQWRSGADMHQGSWWTDWLAWAAKRSGKQSSPPRLPTGEPGPGRYVRNRTGPPVPAPATRTRRSAAARRESGAASAPAGDGVKSSTRGHRDGEDAAEELAVGRPKSKRQ